MTDSRMCAFRVLLSVCNSGAFSPKALDDEINKTNLSQKDISLVSNIVYGTLEKERLLDACINSKLKSSKKLQNNIRIILRMSLYQLLFCDKVPKYSAINEGVELAKTINKPLSNFVNAVLRSIDREGVDVIPDKSRDYKGYLCVKYSVSDYIAEVFINQYGDEAEDILNSFEGRQTITAKVNTCKITCDELIELLAEEGVRAKKTAYFKDVIELTNTGSIDMLNAYKKGFFHIQDLASVSCCSVVCPQKGDIVYDICSAPGGKSFTLAELMNNCGSIISCDVSDKKVDMISDGAKRLGLDIINPICRNGATGKVLPFADKVLCDVPCSGFGVIGKKPEIRRKTFDDVKSLPSIQYDILDHSSLSVKNGGTIVYSTCTLNFNENEAVVERFLKEHQDFKPFPFSSPFCDSFDWKMTLRPDINGTDGFFVARMIKND